MSVRLDARPQPAVAAHAPITVHRHGPERWPEIASSWARLAAGHAFFLSPQWVHAWLEVFGPVLRPAFLVFRAGEDEVGACLLLTRVEARGPFPVVRAHLHTGGEDRPERSSVEYNDVLCRPGWERPVAAALAAHLRAERWDELYLSGFRPGPMLEALDAEFADLEIRREVRQSHHVDLAALRRVGRPYEAALSRNKRWQLRRFARAYEEAAGPVRLAAAASTADALRAFDTLVALHQRAWQDRGHPGAFQGARKVDFHRELIRRSFPRGTIQLLTVTAGAAPIGVLYNFVLDGKVIFYQSGFDYREGFHPGYVTFAAAIAHCLAQGFDEFDFMAGDQQYKRSLSTGSRDLVWTVVRRRSLTNRVLDALATLRRRAGCAPAPAAAGSERE